MYILHDDRGAEPTQVTAIGDENEDIGLMDYVSILDSSGGEWIGQVIQPNLNYSLVGSPYDPTILRGIELLQANPALRITKWVRIFAIELIGQRVGSRMSIARFRPQPGACVRKLKSDETRTLIGLPEPLADGSNVIGILLNADNVPLAISTAPVDQLQYHTMIAGGTGSGKSNVGANFIVLGQAMGKCVVIHDVKPDYKLLAGENTDPMVQSVWDEFAVFDKKPRGVKEVLSVGFYRLCDASEVDQVVGFYASDFPPDLLAGLIFEQSDPPAQSDGFIGAAYSVQSKRAGKPYSLEDIMVECRRRDADLDPPQVPPKDQIHPASLGAIERKVESRKRFIPWIDSVGARLGSGSSSGLGAGINSERTVERLSFGQMVKVRRAVRVHYGNIDSDSDYALLLWWFLSEGHKYRRKNPKGGVPILQFVDEAQRLFDNESRHSSRLTKIFRRVMREGRSQDHSILIALQNAAAVPSEILTNVNTHIVMKQNNLEVSRAATQMMPKEFAQQALRLSTGQAIVQMHEAKAPVLCKMIPSPFELMRPGKE